MTIPRAHWFRPGGAHDIGTEARGGGNLHPRPLGGTPLRGRMEAWEESRRTCDVLFFASLEPAPAARRWESDRLGLGRIDSRPGTSLHDRTTMHGKPLRRVLFIARWGTILSGIG